jgi:hypothetical protein
MSNITPKYFTQPERELKTFTDILIKIDTVGLTCERYNYSFLNVKFHTVVTIIHSIN